MALKFINEDTGDLKTAVFCFTGKAPKTRAQMEVIAIKAGADTTKHITSKTTILVIADANSKSSKAVKARSQGVDLISPSQFFLMCNNITASNGSGQISQITVKKPKPITKPSEKRKHSSVRRIQL